MKLSLIIPCYNEAKSILSLLKRCYKLTSLRSDIEIILVNNGSTDNTSEVLDHFLPNYPDCRSIKVESNQGYGYGILAGLNAAKGDILGWTHADLQTDPIDVLQGLQLFHQYNSHIFVKGQRYGRPLNDIIFTVGMSIFESILFKKNMWDINAQPTLFHRDFFNLWKGPPHDFSLDLYAYYQAKYENLKIYRFPVKFVNRAHGISHWNINWKEKRKFIARTFRYSMQLHCENKMK